jgi:molecular chaperone DnaJ
LANSKRDYYEILGVSREATAQEVKKSYRRLARDHHPDANPDDPSAEERFKELTEAYEVLSNAEARRAYDTYGHQVPRGSGGGQPGGDPFGGVQDIFEAFFGDGFRGSSMFGEGFGGASRGPARGRNSEADIEIDLAEAAFGVEREVNSQTIKNCSVCEGSGGKETHLCHTCGGAGAVRTVRDTMLGQMVSQSACPDCRGAGRIVDVPCDECRGSGKLSKIVSRRVAVPAGIEDGMRLRVSGAGHDGESGSPPGDLYINLKVKEHPELMRDGEDLIHRMKVNFVQATLGTEFRVPTLDGDSPVMVEPGTQPGATVRLRGEGMPRIRGRGRGDIKVVVDVMMPTRITAEQRELLEKFEQISGEETYNGGGASFFERLRGVFR